MAQAMPGRSIAAVHAALLVELRRVAPDGRGLDARRIELEAERIARLPTGYGAEWTPTARARS
ncbi:hypothetical protein GCM10027446_00860 [Angustibacter peucedani]